MLATNGVRRASLPGGIGSLEGNRPPESRFTLQVSTGGNRRVQVLSPEISARKGHMVFAGALKGAVIALIVGVIILTVLAVVSRVFNKSWAGSIGALSKSVSTDLFVALVEVILVFMGAVSGALLANYRQTSSVGPYHLV